MKYCRYCAFCIAGDCYYCTCHDNVMHRIDRATNCKDFVVSEQGDVETGKQYKPRRKKYTMPQCEQITLEEVNNNE